MSQNIDKTESVMPEESSTVTSAEAGSVAATPEVSSQSVTGGAKPATQPGSPESDDDLDPITYEKISPKNRVFIKGSNSKQAFDRASIQKWFDQCRREGKPLTHPMTNEVVSGELVAKPDPTKSKEGIKSAQSAASSQSLENQENPVDRMPAARSSSFEQPRWIVGKSSLINDSTINNDFSISIPITLEKLRDLLGQDIGKIQQLENGFCHEDLKHIKFSGVIDDQGQVILRFKNYQEAREFFSYLENRKNEAQNDKGLGELIISKIKSLFEINSSQNQYQSPIPKK